MNFRYFNIIVIVIILFALGCGGDKPKSKTGKDGKAETTQETKNKQHEQAKSRIEKWLGEEASKKVSTSASVLANKIGANAAKDPTVQKAISKLINSLFNEKSVKKRTDKIADKATSGLKNKFKLLGKAIAAGGVDEYKAKIKKKTTRIAQEVLEDHIKNKVLKDPRMSKVIKTFLPVLSLQGKLAAATLQSNLSPKVAQKIFGISLKLSVEGKSEETSKQVETWISKCDGHVENQLESLFKSVSELKSVEKAVEGLAVEILSHKTTKIELAKMASTILDDKTAFKSAVKAYENVAFDKSDKTIRTGIQQLIDLPIVDTELFKSLEVLAGAPGAGDLIEKHMTHISEDPKMAALIDEFLINLLVTCGDIPI